MLQILGLLYFCLRALDEVMTSLFFETNFSQISRNITTNEMANVMRYSYLRGVGGRFRNPYDHGIKKNCSDFLINGYSEDVEYNEDSAARMEEGVGMMNMPKTSSSNMQNGDAYSHHANGNGHGHGHVAQTLNVNSRATKAHHGHVHSANCSHGNNTSDSQTHAKPKTDSTPLGLGLGLGRSTARSIVAS